MFARIRPLFIFSLLVAWIRFSVFASTFLEKLIELAQEREFCKVTLEVRDDNTVAQAMYKELGFADCEPKMHFWTKKI